MAKPGVRAGSLTRGLAARENLVRAARATLVDEGFSRTSARAIAARAGCSQASVFYHFEAVPDLLLAVLDEISARRMALYREPLLAARSPATLLRLGRRIADDDLRTGDLKVLAEVVAGAASVAGLGPQVADRIVPWEALCAEVAARFIPSPLRGRLRPDAVAHLVVAAFLGLELLRDLRGDTGPTDAVFDGLAALGGLAGAEPSGEPS